MSLLSDRVLKSPAKIMDLFINPFISASFLVMHFEALILGSTHLQLLYSYAELPHDHYITTFFVSCYSFWLSLFCLISTAYPFLFGFPLCRLSFPFLHFEFMSILKAKVSLLLGAQRCVLLLFACFLIYPVILSFDLRI